MGRVGVLPPCPAAPARPRMIVDDYRGSLPGDPQSVRALPGVGRYMAGAILSFAFDLPGADRRGELPARAGPAAGLEGRPEGLVVPGPALDRRPNGWSLPGEPASSTRRSWTSAPWSARPRSPSCLLCPLAALCTARRLGMQDVLPVMAPKPPPLAVSEACAIVVRDGPVADGAARRRGTLVGVLGVPHHQPGRGRPGRPILRQRGQPGRGGGAADRAFASRSGPELKTLTYSVTRTGSSCGSTWRGPCSGTPRPGPRTDHRELGRARRPCMS